MPSLLALHAPRTVCAHWPVRRLDGRGHSSLASSHASQGGRCRTQRPSGHERMHKHKHSGRRGRLSAPQPSRRATNSGGQRQHVDTATRGSLALAHVCSGGVDSVALLRRRTHQRAPGTTTKISEREGVEQRRPSFPSSHDATSEAGRQACQAMAHGAGALPCPCLVVCLCMHGCGVVPL